MYAKTAGEVLARRKAFLAKWKLRCRPVATSLEEAGERLFTFVRYPPEQWRSPCAATAAMLFWALLAWGQITMRRIDRSPTKLDLAAWMPTTMLPDPRCRFPPTSRHDRALVLKCL